MKDSSMNVPCEYNERWQREDSCSNLTFGNSSKGVGRDLIDKLMNTIELLYLIL